MTDTVRVRPWPGFILDGIPPQGADIPRALAEEWINDRLVIRAAPLPVPDRQQPTQRSGGARPKRQGKPSNG